MKLPDIKRGQWLVIRVDGTEEPMEGAPTLDKVSRAIGCECIDAVCLVKDHGRPTVVMMVDDTGMVDHKPINAKATAMRDVARGFSPFAIHGDVAIVNDEDFA